MVDEKIAKKTLFEAKEFSLFKTHFASKAEKVSQRDFRLSINTPHKLDWTPGQFVMLRWGQHLIGRPFAIVDWQEGDGGFVLEIWVRRLGAATEELFCFAEKGRPCEVTLPLGTSLPSAFLKRESKVLFVSGGVGAASVLPVWRQRRALGCSSDFWIHGERAWNDFDASLGCDVLCLEDSKGATRGFVQGRVTAALDSSKLGSISHVLCCGPTPMLQALSSALEAMPMLAKLPCYLGLEEKMGCGIGLCFSCSVKTTEGMQRCCMEGPWFERKKIVNHFTFRGGRPDVS
ncbi:hypothetical protein GW915_13585 [bacterium]|nr:hypothetical protein [bacterium]